MAAITEAALQGEWFYLEEDAPLDRANPEFFILREGVVRSSRDLQVGGTYEITYDRVVLTFTRRGQSGFVMTLNAAGNMFDETTPSLPADATYRFEGIDGPVNYYGTFVRRIADYAGTAEVWRRVR
jgi:hypothetical protein